MDDDDDVQNVWHNWDEDWGRTERTAGSGDGLNLRLFDIWTRLERLEIEKDLW